ncbi:MAG TPA: putative toxin-antitoxin system toxin component, PIN family [Candidatus Baltobacteraceae bacterium]|nr:putative toxin-antitoxin system toxin component, PIN family [Candidatus Baltobacteraceae bacterium]
MVLDTNILVCALRSQRGASNRLLIAAVQRRLTLLASVPLFLEWEAVIKRPEHRLVHGLSLERLDIVLSDLAVLIEPVQLDFLWRPQTHDASDEMVIEAAVNGRADAIITHNFRDLASAAARFGIAVFSPQDALKRWFQ